MSLYIKTEIFIHKNQEDVWTALLDFPAYPKWNPFLTRVERIGENELLVVASKNTFKPKIIEMTPPQQLRWRGKLGNISGIFTGEHYFVLSPEGDGTRFLQGENFSGILAWLLWPFIKNQIQKNFESMNVALKELVEKS